MPDYYYQIKGKVGDNNNGSYFSNWAFPPIYSGMVTADNKQQAKSIIDAEYGKVFPLRVLQKDLDSNEFLLKIDEIKPDDHHTKRLFITNVCEVCGNQFRVIDKYNDKNVHNKGSAHCSDHCANEAYQLYRFTRNQNENLSGVHKPVIYKITNAITGLSYVGKTTQAFTLRWYQHFFQPGDTKFHTAIKSCMVHDWSFQVIEVIDTTDIKSTSELEKIINERERFWINHFNTVINGYNTI